nr:aldehyde dehydrogenase family protein [Methylomonas koyamae]
MTYQSINPASGELIASFPEVSDTELERAIADADRTYRSEWRRRSVGERAGIVAKAATLLRARKTEYAQYLTLEMGKLIGEAETEVELAASILDYYADNAATFLKPKTLPNAPNAQVSIEPIGTILA